MGHPGKIRMLQQLRGSTWWPGLTADVKKYEDSCIGCKASAGNNATPPMEIRAIPDRPWQHLSADYKGPIGGKYYFHVLIDNLTRWPEVAMVKSTGFEALSGKLEETFAIHGVPDSITHDNGPCYNSRDWRSFAKKMGLRAATVHTGASTGKWHSRTFYEGHSQSGACSNSDRTRPKN